MPIKNYKSRMPASQSISLIQQSLISHGAKGILFEYDDQGRISKLNFILEIKDKKIPFALPVEWRKFQKVLQNQSVSRAFDDDYCYRVAWANIRDLILEQMAFLETEMIEAPQLFLGHVILKSGQTLYEDYKNNQLLLDKGEDNQS